MITHQPDFEAHIAFCPETRHMVISFTGPACSGMPPFSNELASLALGAASVTFDLSAIPLINPQSTIDAILSALGTDEDDPAIEILIEPPGPSKARPELTTSVEILRARVPAPPSSIRSQS